MRILVATDGTLPVAPAVKHVERLHDGDAVFVMTAVSLPRDFLRRIGSLNPGGSIEEIVDAAGPGMMGMGGGDRVAERLTSRRPDGALDQLLERYNAEVARERTEPLVTALADAGIEAKTLVRESQERTAATIIEVCRERRIDLLVIGSTGRGRFEGRVGSTGTKLFRNAPTDVLMVRVGGNAPE